MKENRSGEAYGVEAIKHSAVSLNHDTPILGADCVPPRTAPVHLISPSLMRRIVAGYSRRVLWIREDSRDASNHVVRNSYTPRNGSKPASRWGTLLTNGSGVLGRFTLSLALKLAAWSPLAWGAEGPWTASVDATTDYIYRGVSQTYDRGALQLGTNPQSGEGLNHDDVSSREEDRLESERTSGVSKALVTTRDTRLVSVLEGLLSTEQGNSVIGILYGAKHMSAVTEILVGRRGYQVAASEGLNVFENVEG